VTALEVSLLRVAVPQPGSNEVLIRIEGSPINPSDLGLLFGAGNIGRGEPQSFFDYFREGTAKEENLLRRLMVVGHSARFGGGALIETEHGKDVRGQFGGQGDIAFITEVAMPIRRFEPRERCAKRLTYPAGGAADGHAALRAIRCHNCQSMRAREGSDGFEYARVRPGRSTCGRVVAT
jgi:hypothetical protein